VTIKLCQLRIKVHINMWMVLFSYKLSITAKTFTFYLKICTVCLWFVTGTVLLLYVSLL